MRRLIGQDRGDVFRRSQNVLLSRLACEFTIAPLERIQQDAFFFDRLSCATGLPEGDAAQSS